MYREEKIKSLFQNNSYVPSLISINASLERRDRCVVTSGSCCWLFLLINIPAANTPAMPAFGSAMQTPTKRGSPAPQGALFWTGLQLSNVSS